MYRCIPIYVEVTVSIDVTLSNRYKRVCIHTSIYTYIPVCIQWYLGICREIGIWICASLQMHIYIYIYIYTGAYMEKTIDQSSTCIYTCKLMSFLSTYESMCICMCKFVCVPIHAHVYVAV